MQIVHFAYGVAVTFMATYDVLQRAKEAGCNFIIAHEPTYYHGADDKSRLGPDAIVNAKDKFIEDNGLVKRCFRCRNEQGDDCAGPCELRGSGNGILWKMAQAVRYGSANQVHPRRRSVLEA